jgi:hypothetical protein
MGPVSDLTILRARLVYAPCPHGERSLLRHIPALIQDRSAHKTTVGRNLITVQRILPRSKTLLNVPGDRLWPMSEGALFMSDY